MQPDGPFDEAQDDGCLRWVYGIPLVLLNLVTGGLCWGVLITRPQGIWDDDALAGIAVGSLMAIACGTLTLVLTTPPVLKRVMSRWWLAPPVGLMAIAAARWFSVGQQYP